MQFLLLDVGLTTAFLSGYLTVVALQRRRALAVPGAAGTLSRQPRPARSRVGGKPGAAGNEGRKTRRPRGEWPWLSYPR